MNKRLINALVSVYRDNNNAAKCDVASSYFHGSAGAVKNHKFAYQIFSELKKQNADIISKNDDANLCLGLFAYLEKNYDIALTHIVRLPANKVRSDILFSLANWAYDNRRYGEAATLYRNCLLVHDKLPLDIVDFVKNQGLSSIFHLGDKERFYCQFVEKINNKSRLTEENIKLFCTCIHCSHGINQVTINNTLEKIYALNDVDASVKKEIAEYLTFEYNAEPQKALFWARLSANKQLINEQKVMRNSYGIRKKFRESVQQQITAIIHTITIFLLFVGGYIYWTHWNKISIFIHIPIIIVLAFFVLNILRYLILKEKKKLVFVSRTFLIALLLALLSFLYSKELQFIVLTMVFVVDFTFMYVVFFFMAEQLKKMHTEISEYTKKLIRSFNK